MKRLIVLLLILSAIAPLIAQDKEFVAVSVADFDTISEKPGDRLGESISESLSDALTMVSGIKLYERSQLERITGELQLGIEKSQLFDQSSMQEVGRLVSIDYYVLGSVTRVGDNVRITVRLTEIRTGNAILSTRLQGAYLDLFDLQDELAYLVIDSLDVQMSALEKRRIDERRPDNMEAFEVYNLALSEGDLNKRKTLLEEARAKDPGYTVITQCLADTYLEMGQGSRASLLYRELLEQDPQNYAVRYNLAVLLFDQNRIPDAREAFKECVERRPDDADALYNLGLLHEMSNDGTRLGPGADLERALKQYKRVLQISPNYPNALYASGIINIMWAQGETDPVIQKGYVEEAIEYLERYLEAMPQAFNSAEVEQNLAIFRGVLSQLEEITG